MRQHIENKANELYQHWPSRCHFKSITFVKCQYVWGVKYNKESFVDVDEHFLKLNKKEKSSGQWNALLTLFNVAL